VVDVASKSGPLARREAHLDPIDVLTAEYLVAGFRVRDLPLNSPHWKIELDVDQWVRPACLLMPNPAHVKCASRKVST
jgi:hypothetical protein